MTRLNRILALALTLVLMLGAVVGVASSAAHDDNGYIIAANVAYDDAIAPMFAISKELAAPGSILVTVNGVKAEYKGTTVDLYGELTEEQLAAGETATEAHIFKAAGIAPKLLDADLTIEVSVGGEVVSTAIYNVINDYFQAKIDAGATGNKKALYEAVLAYAAAAKAQFG